MPEIGRFDLVGRVYRVAEEWRQETEVDLAHRRERGELAERRIEIDLRAVGLGEALDIAVGIGVHGARIGIDADAVDAAREGGVADIVARVAQLVLIRQIGAQRDVERVGGHETQRDPPGRQILVVHPVAGGLVIFEPVALLVREADRQEGGVGDRRVAIGDDAVAVIIAVGALHMERGIGRRLAADELDDAADRILAEQCALRSAQHLDALQIHGVEIGDAAAPGIDAVDEYHHRGVAAGILADPRGAADAAHREILVDRIDLADAEAGGAGGDILHGFDIVALELLGIERRHRDRHVLKPLLAALRGDDDVAGGLRCLRILRCGGGSFLRPCRRRHGKRRRERARHDDQPPQVGYFRHSILSRKIFLLVA